MGNKIVFILSGVIAGAMLLTAGANILIPYLASPVETYVDYNHIRGSAVEHRNKLYTLNFDQQNFLAAAINGATPYDASSPLLYSDIASIRLYLFDQDDVVITPQGYRDSQLVFTCLVWNNGMPLEERTDGELKKILEKAFDR